MKQTRRRYKFNYGDVGELSGVSAQACRKWFKRRGIALDVNDSVGNLKKVVMYAKNTTSNDNRS